MAFTKVWEISDDFPSSETTKTISLPAGLQAGDFVVIFIASDRNNDLYRITGDVTGPWRNIGNAQSNNPAASAYYGRMIGGIDTEIVIDSGADLGQPHVYIAQAWRGGGSTDRSAVLVHVRDLAVAPFAPEYTTFKDNVHLFALSAINGVDAESAGVTAPDGYSDLLVQGLPSVSVMMASVDVAAKETVMPLAQFAIAGGLAERTLGISFALAEEYVPPSATLPITNSLLASVDLAGAPIETATKAVIGFHGKGGGADKVMETILAGLDADALLETAVVVPVSATGFWFPSGAEAEVLPDNPELLAAIAMAQQVVYAVRSAGIPLSQIVVFGFSQGSVLVLELTETWTRGPVPFRAVIASAGYLNGVLVGIDHQLQPSERYPADVRGLLVSLGGHERDFQVTEKNILATKAFLEAQGADVTYTLQPGAFHTMDEGDSALIGRAVSTERPEYTSALIYGRTSASTVAPFRQDKVRTYKAGETWHIRGLATAASQKPLSLVGAVVTLKIGDGFTKSAFVEDSANGRFAVAVSPSEQIAAELAVGSYPFEIQVSYPATGEYSIQFAGTLIVEESLFASV